MNIDTQGSCYFDCSLIFFPSLEIRLNSAVQSKQSVEQNRPLAPPAAWRPESIASLRLW